MIEILEIEDEDKEIKKRNVEIENELIAAEKKYNVINENLKEIQLKLSELKESKARNEALIEGRRCS